jgi:phosphatidylinositol glycan class U
MENLIYLAYAVAGIMRYWLLNSDYKQTIGDRVEISTPLNSWRKVTEGAYLYNEGINPYVGDNFHETPLGLIVFDKMINHIPQWIGIIFIVCDIVTAHVLYHTARTFMSEMFSRQTREKDKYAKDTEALLLKQSDLVLPPVYVASAYLFNPYIIFSCVGQTTTVFANLCLAFTFLLMIKGQRLACCSVLALATLQSLYPATLLVPASIYLAQAERTDSLQGKQSLRANSFILTAVTFIAALLVLLYISSELAGGWEFLHATYGFM